MNARARDLASAAVVVLMALGAAALGACGRSRPFQAAQSGAEAPDPGYRAAPQVSGAMRAADGAVTLTGRALPSAQVKMISLRGLEAGPIRANGSGVWTVLLGPVSEPVLYSLAEESGGRTVSAEGLIAVLPGAPTVAVLRAGFGAQVVQGQNGKPLEIQAVDYDLAGAAVVSGRARAGSAVRVMVDGQAPTQGAAGPDGRFSLTLPPKPVPPGPHRLQVATPQASVEVEVVLTPPAATGKGGYQAQAERSGWRVDWTTPGGGAQTTLLLAG
jgi:hypothetical protein